MINIIYPNGVKVPAYDDGTPVSPMPDWTQDVYDTIRERFEAGYFEEVAPPVDIPAPDWTSFNLTLIPPAPGSQTSFEVWLEQFKTQHQSPLVSAAGLGHLEETQRLYDSLKAISQDGSTPQAQPTAEQVAEWQGIADANHVPLRF